MSTITGINPTFYLKKIRYDDIVQKYNSGQYHHMPTLETSTRKYFGTLIYDNSKIVGWKTIVGSTTLIIRYNQALGGLCAQCEFETTNCNLCSFGIPIKIEKHDDTITIYMDSETCSLNCSALSVKKFGRVGMSLNPKYVDVNSMIRGLFNLYFPEATTFKEAPPLTDLVKYGGDKTPAVYKSELQFYYYKEPELFVGTPKLVLKENNSQNF